MAIVKRVKVFDVETGKYIVVLNEAEATLQDFFLSDRIALRFKGKEIAAIVDTSRTLVGPSEIAVYHEVCEALGVKEGDEVEIRHLPLPASVEYIRKKLDRRTLTEDEIATIVREIVENKLSEAELASFVAGVYMHGFGIEETVALSKVMVETGDKLELGVYPQADKHCLSWEVPVLIKNSGSAMIKPIGELIDEIFDNCGRDIQIIDGAEFTNKNLNNLQVLVFDDNGFVTFKEVSGVFRVKSPPFLYKISLLGNREITVTEDHTIFTLKNGKIINVKAAELKEGDNVIVPCGIEDSCSSKEIKIGEMKFLITKDLAKLFGYYVSVGFSNSKGIFFNYSSHKKELVDDTIKCIKSVFGITPIINRPHKTLRICVYRKDLAKLFDQLCLGKDVLSKRIPPFIFDVPNELKKEFVKALFNSGYAMRGHEAMYVTSSKELAIDLQYLLSLLGCSVSLSKSKGKLRKFPTKNAKRQDSYFVRTQVKEIFGKKANVSFLNLLPIAELGEIEEEKIGWEMRKSLREQKYITKQKLSKILDAIKSNDVKKLIRGQISVLRVKRIERIPPNSKYVYDVEVPGHNKFMAGTAPICIHNCIGGVAGNRTTMVIVPLLAAAGVYIAKTSSRAITSPAGTADTMEVLAPVVHPIDELRRIVLKTKGCIVWGGAINLAPVDDKLIRIRNTMHLDPRGLLLASIMGKKKAVGAQYLVVDIPVGRGAKIENESDGRSLANDFIQIGDRLGIKTRCLITDGSDPVGFGIGPALECADVLNVLEGKPPTELLEKSCLLAGHILEMVGRAEVGRGAEVALKLIQTGKALEKMREIIEAQGGNPKIKIEDLPIGQHRYAWKADRAGRVAHVDNKAIAKIARAAGAPKDVGAGVILRCETGDKVNVGDTLFEIVAESEAKLSFAIETAEKVKPFELQKIIIGKVE